MYSIQLNESGTRRLDISEAHLLTVRKYSLFRDLVDSSGYVNEQTLDKLKLNVRSLMATGEAAFTDLLPLCAEVVFHNKMKAFGLRNLILLYTDWEIGQLEAAGAESPTPED